MFWKVKLGQSLHLFEKDAQILELIKELQITLKSEIMD